MAIPLVNPIPTSGQVRYMRQRLSRRLAPLNGADVLSSGSPEERIAAQARPPPNRPADGQPRASNDPAPRWTLSVLAAVTGAGLDLLERASDDTHDTVEENLARIAGLPRTVSDNPLLTRPATWLPRRKPG